MKVKGITGHAHATHRGTIKWHIDDDQGLVHVMIIHVAYLIPDAPTRILSPQLLAQQADDHYPREEGTGALTTSKNITLFWAQCRYVKTVPLDTKKNVGLTTTAAGARSFRAFCATIKAPETIQPNIFKTHVAPDDDEESKHDESLQPEGSDRATRLGHGGQDRHLGKTRRTHDPRAATDHDGRSRTDHARHPRGPGTDVTGPSRRVTTLALSPGTFVVRMHTTTGSVGTTAQTSTHL